VFLRALERNAEEGRPGELISIDIAASAGWLAAGVTPTSWQLLVGDTRTLLPAVVAGAPPDLFLHDSDHSYEHETYELETALGAAAPGAVLISDNAHGGQAFADFCDRHRLPHFLFRERPKAHFYPGAGIGVTTVPEASGGSVGGKGAA
jgi:predicted O-methyltransferase YrrM